MVTGGPEAEAPALGTGIRPVEEFIDHLDRRSTHVEIATDDYFTSVNALSLDLTSGITVNKYE
ncbi:hypothetical protein [Actinoallomurus acaciae]|uniref:Uncharacterized protein n=1 Tax=Actinoallomurus acaciae TaxID=502577 RepID=A0ABV5Y9B6_9ACTN